MNLSAINTIMLTLIIGLHAFIGKQVWDMKMSLTEASVEQRHMASSMTDLRARIAAVELRATALEANMKQMEWTISRSATP